MSSVFIPSIMELPVEVLYCILDRLDTKDILFSFRNVCRHFHAITDNYNQYKVRVTCTSPKADIHRLCRIIRPQNIASCIIVRTTSSADNIDDRIQSFLSLIDMRQFTRLRSLEIFDTTKDDSNAILGHISYIPTLMLLKWKNEGWMAEETIDLLSSIIATSNLRKLHLHCINPQVYTRIPIPNQCKLEALTVDICDHRDLCNILHYLPNLRAFSSSYYPMEGMDQIDFSTSFQQLTSLSLRSPHMLIDQVESLLSVTPSLVNLHIVNYSATFNFLQRISQWEKFISRKLPLLQKFKFYTYSSGYDYRKASDIDVIMRAFRTSSWLENKCGYVTCQYLNNDTRRGIMLYSSTDSSTDFPNNLEPAILSYSTSTTKSDSRIDGSSMWNIRLNLLEMDNAISSNEVCTHINLLGFF